MFGKTPPELNWWAERWQQYLLEEVQGWLPTESKLRGARKAVVKLSVEKGRVTAVVAAGSFGQTYTASLKVKPLGEREWRRAVDAIAADASAAQRILAGHPGPELERIFDRVDLSLFPLPTVQRPLRCTCREGGGCRHVNVLAVHGGQLFAGNPFLWLEALGRPRADLLALVRARLADLTEVTTRAEVALTAALPGDGAAGPDSFWATELDPDTITVRPGSAPSPDGLLRLLGPLPLPDEADEPEAYRAEDLLRRYAVHIGRSAADLARGELAPDYREGALPGKAVPLKARLATEIAAAVRKEGAVMTLEQLLQACPTAAAANGGLAVRALADAMELLEPELVSLLGYYAGPRSAMLEGAAFRHVVTFAEWRTGRLSADADWVLALLLVAGEPPYALRAAGQLFMAPEPGEAPGGLLAALGAEVGDELSLEVADLAHPMLTATLRRRAERGVPEALAEANHAAIHKILEHMCLTRAGRMRESAALAVLLAEGAFRGGAAPDPVWLLAARGAGLHSEGSSRIVSAERWYSQPPLFGRPLYGHWQGRESAIGSFGIALAQRGASRREMEAAVATVRFWCDYYLGGQDQPDRLPPLAALLNFLWVTGPVEAKRRRLDAERLPEHLGAWFEWLGEKSLNLRAGYGPHLAACGFTRAYADRLATLPLGRTGEADLLAWRLEGYRWMGAELYHTPSYMR